MRRGHAPKPESDRGCRVLRDVLLLQGSSFSAGVTPEFSFSNRSEPAEELRRTEGFRHIATRLPGPGLVPVLVQVESSLLIHLEFQDGRLVGQSHQNEPSRTNLGQSDPQRV